MEAREMALDKVFKRRNRYEIPEWQREEVWSTERKQLLIDTILRGWKLPKLYFAKTSDSPDEFEVVDGQQRLATIFEFFESSLSLSAPSSEEFGGATYEELPEPLTDAFDDFQIQYDEITEASDAELQQFFQRLQGGMQLTAAEKLNAVGGNLTKFARSLGKHSFFREKVAIADTRKAYFDIASKVAAIEIEGLSTGVRYEDLKAIFDAQSNFSAQSNVARRLRDTLDYLSNAFPARSPVLRSRSTIQSYVTLGVQVVQSGWADGNEEALREFFEHFGEELAHQVELGKDATDPDYLEFQRTQSANVKVGPKTRHRILLRKLLLYDSGWAEILGAEVVVSSGLSADIERLGKSVASLVEVRNDEHSAKHGADLFKVTNKTVAALRRLREPIKDYKTYSRFIDDLYFVFHEGAGQRLAGQVPPSFEDVNLLRTGLQHDVDHGKKSAVAAKKKKIGQAFARYAGVTSPATLAPERFPIVQATLLQAVEADLSNLSV